jgi:hypothetical protein
MALAPYLQGRVTHITVEEARTLPVTDPEEEIA